MPRKSTKYDYEAVRAIILKEAAKGKPFTAAGLARAHKAERFSYQTAAKELVAEKKLISKGTGAGRKLTAP